MKARKIHKWTCIILFTIMIITTGINTYLTAKNADEDLIKYINLVGYICETPFLIALVTYLYKHHKLKKEG